MSRRRDEEIRKMAERLSAVLGELEDAIAALPQEFRDMLAGPGGEPADCEQGEALNEPG